jgi:hypothetical protein
MKELNLDVANPRTYLLFFGKSQSFSFTAFDNLSAVADFNETILDFDLLESQLFSVDRIDNKQILAKYYFTRNKKYTLLKIYSYAQAYDGDRVQGSIFGVAFLSEANISVCRENIDILRTIKDVFADVCLDATNKFTTSDFSALVEGIWKQFRDQNGFSRIRYSTKSDSVKDGAVGIHVKPVEEAVELNYGKMYFSEDLEHLKRANLNWGKRFPICRVVNGRPEFFRENVRNETGKNDEKLSEDNDRDFFSLSSTIREKNEKIEQLEKNLAKIRRKNKIFLAMNSIILIIISAAVIFALLKQKSDFKPTANEINSILRDQKNFNSLLRLYVNIREEESSENPVREINAIIEDARTLKLPDDFVSFYQKKKANLELNKNPGQVK